MPSFTEKQIWALLEEVKDPEIPVVSVIEMGIVRQVSIDEERVKVVMTPTFSGCPALDRMRSDIVERLEQAGVQEVQVKVSNNPPWTSDWITPEARQKLKAFGLAPPPLQGQNPNLLSLDPVACPYCGSTRTSLKNSFGPTLCRAIFYCNNCQQPFEQFKPL